MARLPTASRLAAIDVVSLPPVPPSTFLTPSISVVVRDEARRESFRRDLTGLDGPVHSFDSGGAFLKSVGVESAGCAVIDPDLPDMTGCELVEVLHVAAPAVSVVIAAERPPLSAVVRLMRSGAFDVLEVPIPADRLRGAVAAALEDSVSRVAGLAGRRAAAQRVGRLTARQREVLLMAIEGLANKVIAARTGVSVRTIERQRAAVFEALGVTTLTGAVEVLRQAGHDPTAGGEGAADSAARRQFVN